MNKKDEKAQFVIQKVQPALLGLMDGSVSTLAPIFATAGLTHQPMKAFLCGACGIAWRRDQHGTGRGTF